MDMLTFKFNINESQIILFHTILTYIHIIPFKSISALIKNKVEVAIFNMTIQLNFEIRHSHPWIETEVNVRKSSNQNQMIEF